MRFVQEYYLLLLILLPIVLWRSVATARFAVRLRAAFQTLHNAERNRWRDMFRTISALLAFGSIVLALSEPQTQKLRTETLPERIRIAIGIDISKSMLAEDVSLTEDQDESVFSISNRLNLARRFALNFLNQMEGEKVGIFFFAKKGVEMAPFTVDYGFIHYMLKYTDITQIAVQGSSIESAVRTGQTMLEIEDRAGIDAMVVITDGEDTENEFSAISKSVEQVRAENIKLFFVGIGKKENALIPIRNNDAITGFYESKQGNYLQTRLEEQVLQNLAKTGGGRYFQVHGGNYGSVARAVKDELYEFSKQLPKAKASLLVEREWVSIASLFLFLGLFAYSGYFLV